MNRRDFLCGGVAAAVAGLVPAQLLAAPSDQAAASFLANAFPDLHGVSVPLSRYAGRPLVVNFWATWCAPCIKEMPDLDELAARHAHVTIVGVAIDTPANVERFLQKVPVSYPILVAGHGGIDKMKELGNRKGGLPYTVIFDSQSRVAGDILGQVDPAELDAQLASLPGA